MPGAHLAPGIFCADLGKMKKTVDNRAKSAYNNTKAKSYKLLIEKSRPAGSGIESCGWWNRSAQGKLNGLMKAVGKGVSRSNDRRDFRPLSREGI